MFRCYDKKVEPKQPTLEGLSTSQVYQLITLFSESNLAHMVQQSGLPRALCAGAYKDMTRYRDLLETFIREVPDTTKGDIVNHVGHPWWMFPIHGDTFLDAMQSAGTKTGVWSDFRAAVAQKEDN